MLAALVAVPSVSSTRSDLNQGNRVVNERLAEWLADLGFDVQVLPLDATGHRTNLVATLGTGSGGLVLSGHTDTVPFDEALWQSDPFRLQERDQRLYGLGITDMKGFLALAVEAASRVDRRQLRRPLTLLATADEETGMAGARALAGLPGFQGRAAVIGEPTGMRPVRAHKGMMMEAISIHGQSGHSSDPGLGNNALEGMHRFMQALLDWRARLQERYRDQLFAIPYPTLNLGHIHGGDNPNRICGDCELHIDLRPLPGMSASELRAGLDAVGRQALQGSGLEFRLRSLMEDVPPMSTPDDSPIVRAAEQQTGHPAGSAAFGTEGPFLNAMGMDTVILVPAISPRPISRTNTSPSIASVQCSRSWIG